MMTIIVIYTLYQYIQKYYIGIIVIINSTIQTAKIKDHIDQESIIPISL